MGVNVQAFALDTSEAAWDLRVQAQLEAGLSLAGAVEAAQLDDLAQAEHDVEEVVFRLIELVVALQLLHQGDELALRNFCLTFVYKSGLNTTILTDQWLERVRLLDLVVQLVHAVELSGQLLDRLIVELRLDGQVGYLHDAQLIQS